MSITNTTTTHRVVGTTVSLEPVLDDSGERKTTSRGNEYTRIEFIPAESETDETEELLAWVALEVAELMYPVGEERSFLIEEKVTTRRSLIGAASA